MPGAAPLTLRLADLTVDVDLTTLAPAHGQILYRGASKWQNLAPGTSGQFLKTQGAGDDPVWSDVSVSPGGSSGQLQYNSSSAFAGAAFTAVATSGALLTLTSQAATDVPLTVKGAAGQSGNLTQWKDSDGNTLAYMDSAGDLTVKSQIKFDDGNGLISRTAAGNTINFQADAANGAAMALSGSRLRLYNGVLELRADTSTDDSEVRTVNKGGNSGNGLRLLIHGGDGSTGGTPTRGGDVQVYGGGGGGGNTNGGDVQLYGGPKAGSGTDGLIQLGWTGAAARGNLALFGAGSFGGGAQVVFLANATTAPVSDPSGGGILYCDGGALKFRGSSGTVTPIAPA